ncbi:DUF885 domain-containing protein [Govanella unica]|uniref:DUF885 domain-containing protein n=1 Tax=Govanella unica TaxID=2975056 RepID=A0A9X3Z6X1_9PROT|nr:DUF885 domain-containing protein [Govania unica]MDA5193458.1 DUF885 domain-containing protein [Govania unica]
MAMLKYGSVMTLVVAAFAATIPVSNAAAAPAALATAQTESERFQSFLNGIYEQEILDSPMLATNFGRKEGYGKWDDISARAEEAGIARVKKDLKTAQTKFQYDKLDEKSKLQYRVFIDEQNLLLDRHRWRNQLYPLNQIVGLQVEVPGILINQHSIDTVADAEAYISRLTATDRLFGQLMDQMRRQAAEGIYMPKQLYPILIADARQVVTGAPYDTGPDSPVWADFNRKIAALDIPADQKAALLAKARVALTTSFKPAYDRLVALLMQQAALSKTDGGVWQLKDGVAFYEFLISQFTTTKMTPADIHDLGLREVARVQHEMQAIMKTVGASGSVIDFMAQTKADPKFYYPDTDEGRMAYLNRARGIVGDMQAKLTEVFFAPAPLPLEVRRTEAYKEASAPSGYYEAGSLDGKRPGVINLNLSNMKIMATFDMDDLLYHEGVPGHHMQISTIMVDKSIPQLRKVDQWWQNSAFVEGWGLYAEGLAKDMGFYKDPYADFGRLSGELWRATRLVVDSGLHYKRWSAEQAIKYLNENTPSSEAANRLAVERYLAVPGQATSFMVGMKKFKDERERARVALGPDFDIREYHNVVLRNGYIPLWAVEQAVDSWIAQKKIAHTN